MENWHDELYHYGVPGMKWGVRKTKRTGIGGRFNSWRAQRNMKKYDKMISKNTSKPNSFLRSRRAYKAERYLNRAHGHARRLIQRQAKKINKNSLSSTSDRNDAARILSGMKAERKLRRLYGEKPVGQLVTRATFENGNWRRRHIARENLSIVKQTSPVVDKYASIYLSELSTTSNKINVNSVDL